MIKENRSASRRTAPKKAPAAKKASAAAKSVGGAKAKRAAKAAGKRGVGQAKVTKKDVKKQVARASKKMPVKKVREIPPGRGFTRS